MGDGRRYKIEGVLGKGGFGTVYKAQLQGDGGFTRQVALKVLNADMQGMEDVARRLRDEARLLGLLRHRSILHVDGLVRMHGRWTVVMEYIEGSDLQGLARSGGVPLGPALEIVEEVASALHVAYTTPSPSGVPLKLLHRDIKPPNILLTAAGEVKVLDFGIARAEFGNREAMTRSVLYGSVGYMAPERLDFEELPEGDVYALGTVLYEILTGSPFGKASIRTERHQQKVDDAIDLIQRKLGPLPPDMPELLGAMLSYDPEDRPSAREVERRCRSIRQQVKGPWLRDWAEKAIPPLIAGRTLDKADDITGQVLSESGGVSLLDAGHVHTEEGGADDNSTLALPDDEPPRKRRGAGALFAGGVGLVGCLGVGGGGALVVLILLVLVMMPWGGAEPTPPPRAASATPATTTATPDASTSSGTEAGGQAAAEAAAARPAAAASGDLSGYSPPNNAGPAARLTGPWSGKDLPVAPGQVTYSDPQQLIVMYQGKELGPAARAWTRAIETSFEAEPTFQYESGQASTASLKSSKGEFNVAVARSMSNIVVSVSLSP